MATAPADVDMEQCSQVDINTNDRCNNPDGKLLLRTELGIGRKLTNEVQLALERVSTSCVSHAFVYQVHERSSSQSTYSQFFIKVNKNKHAKAMFDVEVTGLHAFREVRKNLIGVPQPLVAGYLAELDADPGPYR